MYRWQKYKNLRMLYPFQFLFFNRNVLISDLIFHIVDKKAHFRLLKYYFK